MKGSTEPKNSDVLEKEQPKDQPSNTFSKWQKRRMERLNKKNEYEQARIAEIKKLNKAKLEKKRNKQEYRRQLKKNRTLHWYNLFTKWFFVGLILILIGILISALFSPSTLIGETLVLIFSGLFSTSGIAIMLGSIFDFSKNSEAFIQFISSILSDIVVSKKFLSTLSDNDKENALSMILKPSDRQIEQYSNINALFKKRINDLKSMFDINFKTNVIFSIVAYFDKAAQKVFCKVVYTQTIYKTGDNYKPIEVYFEKAESKLERFYILPPDGAGKLVTCKEEKVQSCGNTYTKCIYEIPEEYEKYDHLTIQRVAIEPGHNHWIPFYWYSVTPYEGLTCQIDCEDDLTIKDYMIFDNKAYYDVVRSENNRRLTIISSQWLEANTGLVAIISRTDQDKN